MLSAISARCHADAAADEADNFFQLLLVLSDDTVVSSAQRTAATVDSAV